MSRKHFDWNLVAFATGILLLLSTTALPAAAASQLPGQFSGEAWGSRANAAAGSLATSMGKSAFIPCACEGTNGEVRTNTTGNVDGGDSYRSGKVVTTAQAEKRPQLRAFAQTTSKVSNVRALSGLITAQSMQAVTTVHADQSTITPSFAGSSITGLKINGQPTTVNPGQRVPLAGFGYVVFNSAHVFHSPSGIVGAQAEMMRIVITRQNDLNIPVGSVITSTHASVAYTREESTHLLSAAAWGSAAHSTSSDVTNRFGRSAPAYVGCLTRGADSATASNQVSSTSYPGALATGSVVNHAEGQISSSLTSTQATSRMENVNLFGGVLTADVIKAVSSSSVDGSGGHASFAGSKFVNLQVLGHAIGDNVAPNTTIPVPGIGSLTLYATTRSVGSNEAHSLVDMVVLHVNQANSQGIPAGTDITLAHAQANATR
jgi:hypothetical protein